MQQVLLCLNSKVPKYFIFFIFCYFFCFVVPPYLAYKWYFLKIFQCINVITLSCHYCCCCLCYYNYQLFESWGDTNQALRGGTGHILLQIEQMKSLSCPLLRDHTQQISAEILYTVSNFALFNGMLVLPAYSYKTGKK